jgi:hypothetical protein
MEGDLYGGLASVCVGEVSAEAGAGSWHLG